MADSSPDGDPVRDLLEEGLERDVFTCAVAAVGGAGGVHRTLAVGESDPETGRRATEESLFDAASLTKPVVTTTLVLGLVERGELALRDGLARHLPELEGTERGSVTLRQLLTHTSGLQPYQYDDTWTGHGDALSGILEADLLATVPGEAYEYSCLNFVHLAAVLERVTDRSLHALAREGVFEPAGMADARVGPLTDPPAEVVVTYDHQHRSRALRGAIHDPIASAMAGRSGNAGLFATAGDLAAFARAILDDGLGVSGRVLSPASVGLLPENRTPEHAAPHPLGWRLAHDDWPAPTWSDRSIGHTGYTGTSLWLDTDADRFAVLLTNDVYTGKDGAIERFRERFHGIVGAGRY
jgi:CubicO group peptidase (beta-lactamase class C family)